MNIARTAPHTIAIVGGSGFVGGHLVSRLAQAGHTLRVFTRRRERHKALLVLPTVQLLELDVHDPAALTAALAGCDVVINLVGILNERGNDGRGFRRAHVELPRKLIEACRANGIRRLLHMSALGADASHGPSHYLRSKGEGEALVHAAHDLDVTSFRPSVIFGPDDSFINRFAGLLRLTPLLFPLACAEARFAPVYVGDVVECFARAIDNHATYGQRYELCGPHSYTLRELVQYTADTLGLKRRIIPLGRPLSHLQAMVLEFAPGKPFSRDNFLSMLKENVCSGEFPALFGITPTALETEVPIYLSGVRQRQRYTLFRRHDRRDKH